MATPAYNTPVAIATAYILDQMTYQFQDANFLSYHYFNEKRGLVEAQNGLNIQVPLMLGEGTNAQMTAGDATAVYSLNVQDNASQAVFNWKFFNNAAVFTLAEMTMAGDGPNSVLDIVKVKSDDAVEQTVNFFASAIYGSGSDSGGQAFDGLGSVGAASGTAYGGITNTSAGYERWLTEIDTTTNVANYANISRFINLINSKSRRRSDKLDIMVSNYACRQDFQRSQQGQQNYYNTQTLEAGFVGDFIKVDGIRWYIDEFCPGSKDAATDDNFIYFLSTDTLKFYRRFGFGKKSPMDTEQVLPNQPIKIAVNNVAGNFVCTKRNSNGVMKNIIA
tara:strand:- start:11579 stop:12580 length:1002 start_codon:yes stop_codon:yes gene_type:complete